MGLAKIIVAGASAVGKTCLVNTYIFKDFIEVSPTIGVNFAQKICVGKAGPLNLSIWDFSGQERFRFLMPQLCAGAAGLILVFDQTQPSTLDEAVYWFKLVSKYSHPVTKPVVVLVGNKSDLPRRITPSQTKQFCIQNEVHNYVQCSAKSGDNVVRVFETICSTIQRTMPVVSSPLLESKR